RTTMEPKMNKSRSELRKLQQAIAQERAEPPLTDVFYWHEGGHGLGLRHYPTGAAKWILQYRDARSRTKRFKLGDARFHTLESAERLARAVRVDIDNGRDPQAEREELRAKARRTLRELCEQYFAEEMEGNPKFSPHTLYHYRNMAKNHLGALGGELADEL